MAEEFKYTLTFDSKATGTGAKDTADAIQRLTVSQKQLTASTGSMAGILDRTTDSTKASYGAFYDLDAAMGKTARTSDTFTAGATQVNRSTRDASRSLLLFSQGFEDAQYGIRGVLNNIPGLVIALGGTAGIAGAISIAAVSFSVLFEWLSKTEEKSSDVADRIATVAAAIGEVEGDRFDDVQKAIQLAGETAEALEDQIAEVKKADSLMAVSVLDNAEKIRLAQANIAAALGLQVDRQKEIIALAAAEEEKRLLAARQAIALEQQRAAEAQISILKAEDVVTETRNRLQAEERNLEKLREQVAALREQRDLLQSIAEGRAFIDTEKDQGLPGLREFAQSKLNSVGSFAGFRGAVQSEAQRRVEDPQGSQALQAAEARLSTLEKRVETLDDTVPRAENALTEAILKATDLQAGVQTNIERIEATLAADQLLAQSEQLVKTGEQSAADIKAAFTDVQTSTAAGAAARAALLAAAADGKITADEVRGVSANLQTLNGLMQAGLAGTSGNVQALIDLTRNLQRTVENQASQIKGLDSRIK